MPFSVVHPFIVHFAITFSVLFGLLELFPKVGEWFPAKISGIIRWMALFLLLLALVSGSLAFWIVKNHTGDLPRMSDFHMAAAITGASLFFLLGFMKRRSRLLPLRAIAGAALLCVLSAAAMGGSLVYQNHVGTIFSKPPR